MLIRMHLLMIRFQPFKWWYAISTEPKVVDQLRLFLFSKAQRMAGAFGWSVIAPHFPFYASKTQPAATLNGVSL